MNYSLCTLVYARFVCGTVCIILALCIVYIGMLACVVCQANLVLFVHAEMVALVCCHWMGGAPM